MPVASVIAGVVAAGTAIGTTVAGAADAGQKNQQGNALMEINHKYATIAEQREMQRQKAADKLAGEQYGLSLADRERAKKANEVAGNQAKGVRSQDRILQTLNNNPAIRERALKIFGGGR
jgi:hypothetical protein